MRYLTLTGVAVAIALSSSAFAQTATPPAAAPASSAAAPAPSAAAPAAAAAAPAAAAASDLTKDGKPRMKVVRAQCRDEVKGENLKGDARKQAMADCIVKQRPDMEARVKCQMDPSLKGMDKEARHAAVKACVAKTKG